MDSKYGKLLRVEDKTPKALYARRVFVSARGRPKEQVEAVKNVWDTLALVDGCNISWFREDDIYTGCYRPR